jgi:hypothetical protein
MKKLSLWAVVLATVLCTTPLSLNWSPNEMPSLSVDRANAQKKVGVNRRPARLVYGHERFVVFWQPLRQLPLPQSVRQLRQSLRQSLREPALNRQRGSKRGVSWSISPNFLRCSLARSISRAQGDRRTHPPALKMAMPAWTCKTRRHGPQRPVL